MSKQKRTGGVPGNYASSYSKSYGPTKPSRWKEVLLILLALVVLAAAIFGLVKVIQNKGFGEHNSSVLNTTATDKVETTVANVGTAHVLTDEEADMIRNSEKYKNIMARKDEYPQYLIDDLEMNPEICDFVADYLNMEPVGHGGLTAAERKASKPLFVQWDKRWGYSIYGEDCMAISACGPTALAMVAYSLTRDVNIDPYAVAQYSMENGHYVNGVGTAWTLMTEGAAHYGLAVTSQSKYTEAQLKDALANGGMVILSVGKGDFTVHNGHFIVLKGYKNGKFEINDPFSYTNSSKLWDYDRLMGQTKNTWIYYKDGKAPAGVTMATTTTTTATTTAAATSASTTYTVSSTASTSMANVG